MNYYKKLEQSEKKNGYLWRILYPSILDGEGRGMQDDISEYKLESIVEDTDKKGVFRTLCYTRGWKTRSIWLPRFWFKS